MSARTRGSTATPSGRGICSPFAFYARILGPERGRAGFYARLGAEAADALDEFLELALLYERGEAPTLQGFVAWLRAGQTEVKRDMDIARDEVRVMTVHGAKGLEAPIVVLADTVTPPKGPEGAAAAQAPRRECRAGHAGPHRVGGPQGRRRRLRSLMPGRKRSARPRTNTGGCSMWR